MMNKNNQNQDKKKKVNMKLLFGNNFRLSFSHD